MWYTARGACRPFIWHTRSWSLENLPPSYYAIAEGAAGYAMRAQALAFVRQATLRPDTARLLFAQADAAIASFHAQIENARTNRHRMQIHNDNVLGLRLTTRNSISTSDASPISREASD